MQQSKAVRVVKGINSRWFSGTRLQQRPRWWMLYAACRMVSDLSHCLRELEGAKRKKIRRDNAIIDNRRRFCQQSLADNLAQQYFSWLGIVPKQIERAQF